MLLAAAERRGLRLSCCALLIGSLCHLRPHLAVLGAGSPPRATRSCATRAGGPATFGRTGRGAPPAGARAVSCRAGPLSVTVRGGERAHVLAIATEYRQEAVILQRAAQLLGYRFQFCGIGDPWVGWGTKLVQYADRIERDLASGDMAPADPVMLIDGWDCAILGPAEEFMEKMASPPFSTEQVPWYAGERIAGPDFFYGPRIDAIYGDPGTPWKYPNAGGVCGRAEAVLRLMQDLLAGPGTPGAKPFSIEEGNDQGRLHEHLMELGERGEPVPMLVDSRCRVFQCLYEAEPQWDLEDDGGLLPRLRNRLTGERPVVLHGNGHTGRWFLQGLWREMEFLPRVGLTLEDLAHLPFDGPVAPGTVPDAATEKNWLATFDIYRIIEMQMAYARIGIAWDPWKVAAGEQEAPSVPPPGF